MALRALAWVALRALAWVALRALEEGVWEEEAGVWEEEAGLRLEEEGVWVSCLLPQPRYRTQEVQVPFERIGRGRTLLMPGR